MSENKLEIILGSNGQTKNDPPKIHAFGHVRGRVGHHQAETQRTNMKDSGPTLENMDIWHPVMDTWDLRLQTLVVEGYEPKIVEKTLL